MSRRFQTLLAASTIALMASAAVAQNQNQNQNPNAAQPAATAPQNAEQAKATNASSADAQIAAALVLANRNEVILSQLAQQQAQDPEVKQFAERMIQDHQKMIQTLQAFAGSALSANAQSQATQPAGAARTTDQPAADRASQPNAQPNAQLQAAALPATRQGERTAVEQATTVRAQGGLDFVSIQQEMADQCLQSARRELEQKQGAEFDKCYVGMALGAHMHAADAIRVFERHAGSELQKALADGLKTTEEHLAHAKQLMKRLDQTRRAPNAGR